MAGVSTEELMQWALDFAGQREIPPDSAVYYPGSGIQKVLFGIDVGAADLLLARHLGVDAVIAHHPADALVDFPRIFERHVELMTGANVPADVARAAVAPLEEQWRHRLHAANYDHTVSVARLLGMPFLNIHNPLDEVGRQRMADAVRGIDPDEPLSAVVAALNRIPEIRDAPTRVRLALGAPSDPAGRIMVVHGAGTNGGAPIARAYYQHGINTVIYIHVAPDALAQLRAEAEGHLIVVGHLAGDLAGIQPFADLLRARGLDVIGFSGIR